MQKIIHGSCKVAQKDKDKESLFRLSWFSFDSQCCFVHTSTYMQLLHWSCLLSTSHVHLDTISIVNELKHCTPVKEKVYPERKILWAYTFPHAFPNHQLFFFFHRTRRKMFCEMFLSIQWKWMFLSSVILNPTDLHVMGITIKNKCIVNSWNWWNLKLA